MKVIITHAGSRQAFDVINILKREYGLETILFSKPGKTLYLSLVYRQKVNRLDCEMYENFRADFEKVLNRYKGEKLYYMAISEKATLHFYDYVKERPSTNISYLLPEKEVFELTRNKDEFQQFCEMNRLPVPRSYDKMGVEELAASFNPVVAKKKIGAGSMGMKYVETKDQIHLLDDINYDSYLIQEKIESSQNIHGGFFLSEKGKVHVYHGHFRIRTFPENGGVTVFSKADLNEELKSIGTKVLKKLNWSGFAMIEFMFDQNSKEWKIIELNPRLWGSVMLSEFCNSSMLINYVRLCQGKPLRKKRVATDRYIRWFFPFEIVSFLKGRLGLTDFFNIQNDKTCYINFTYSGWGAALLYLLYFTFNGNSISRFFKKIFP
ncbi:ATP-grasp domain-containing protein [Fodinibius saliphilus]|uniref:ATP-grasp domain-containing protein n=1 Tax=Fodinibius saliphilus TaxID=1920650 RepID=UPI001109A9EF|nr:ATP-grasp domain-containing protein [Fodinibius saliphilus]